jgi:hypothetical protein
VYRPGKEDDQPRAVDALPCSGLVEGEEGDEGLGDSKGLVEEVREDPELKPADPDGKEDDKAEDAQAEDGDKEGY